MARPPCIHHCTSEPCRFFGRAAELGLLDAALGGGAPSVVALVGPGGQGKTAIVQHWLAGLEERGQRPDGVFLWSFYRGKDADLCLRALYAYAFGVEGTPDLSASYCVDHLLPVLRRERWAVVLDGAEVAQHEGGPWGGRFVHPELGRLLEELAAEPLPGVVVLTTRFELPTLERRRHARVLSLDSLDAASARSLLAGLGVQGDEADLDSAAAAAGRHAKAVELLATFLVRFRGGDARRYKELPDLPSSEEASEEERRVARVLGAFQEALPEELKDVLALATAFRDPPAEDRLLAYLASGPVHALLHDVWGRIYTAFGSRPAGWLGGQVQELIDLRLLERVGRAGPASRMGDVVIDAHPLVRRAFEGTRGSHTSLTRKRRESAQARAGFLRGRPDRRRPQSLEEAREEVELFHAYCEAGLWNEADGTLVALDNLKHRLLAPALEHDLLVRFFPGGDWRQPPLWPGFGRWRSLAIALEMLGRFSDALAAYREPDAPLRGDALIALGRLGPLLEQAQAPAPWQTLWNAYRCHALALAGQAAEALALARTLVPVDVYEWVHVFECLLRLGRLDVLDLRSLLFRPPRADEHRWADLARRRMKADYLRLRGPAALEEERDLEREYRELVEAYDRGGLPFERALVRLSQARWLLERRRAPAAREAAGGALDLARRYGMRILEADARALLGGPAEDIERLRQEAGYAGPLRP
jgi:tetratricopeptide (TPR) repeat protein